MNKFLVVLGIVALAVFGYTRLSKPQEKPLGGSFSFSYNTPTMASSSVGIYSHSLVLATNPGRAYASICNASNSVPTSNDAVFLQFDATSTKPFGLMVKPQECYQMTTDNMFIGNIYAIASTATSTLLMLSK